MSEVSCENCGAYKAKEGETEFYCNEAGWTNRQTDRYKLPKICRHYPVPKPPEPSEVAKAKQQFADEQKINIVNVCKDFDAGFRAGRKSGVREFLEKCKMSLSWMTQQGYEVRGVVEKGIIDIVTELEAKE